ncbi:MAG: 2-C-methyl-D-erythritol 4-phosphate cytidylyltransferase [Candidatus Eisenbacteria bacterium]|uniref:2-C-methyl-D-erythritol 4-phosphate cytidylyltransferase n=1 Tax=Eiseniibacteriota bacterium TaxID=2212470 RepID=A0A956NEK6_UNCEI|nr:2-C-methyl-D-erythritol 4-phosphate cytidylyltransferase [Candidatus Eisenbacteria bacterium]MCB9463654.1 2-C-methyl-D-erythritol 4-phosphate cytidylyltransferase [Candidatus Eisenbacteria bacterium]
MNGCDVLLLAGGRGERLGHGRPKALVPLLGRPLFAHAFERFASHPRVERIVLVVPADPSDAEEVRAAVRELPEDQRAKLMTSVLGGAERQDSVRAGLEALARQETERRRIVLVHDSARPVVTHAIIDRCLAALENGDATHPASHVLPGLRTASWGAGAAGVVPGLPVRETLKLVYSGRVVMTQPREQLYAVQTPQGFRFGPLLEAHRRAEARGHQVTDDAGLLEWLGIAVVVVPGDSANIKVTYPEDLVLLERMLAD